MSEALVLVVLLGTAMDPAAEGVIAAVRRALGPETTVLADTSSVASDADALAIGNRVHARAVARVTWSDGAVARLHVRVAPSDDWMDDELTFSPQDAASEKGRTVGYALASMVQQLERERSDNEVSSPIIAAEAQPEPPKAAEPVPSIEARPASPSKAPGSDLDLFVQGHGALGGGATAAGGSGGLRWWPFTSVGFRVAVGARAGAIPEADATTTTLFTGAGPAFRIRLSSLELGVRADLVLLRHSVVRDRTVERARARWLGAASLVLEGGWALGPHAGLVAGVGTELAFGKTDVDVGGVTVADIPPVRGIAELGARIRF